MLFFRNPLFCATAAVRAAFNSDHDGKALQPLICSLSGTCASADAAPRTSHIIVTSMGTKTFFLFIIFPLLSPFLLTFEFVLCQRHDVNVFTDNHAEPRSHPRTAG